MGKSPLLTVHDADTMSIALISSLPKSNGTICGRTFGFVQSKGEKKRFLRKKNRFSTKRKIQAFSEICCDQEDKEFLNCEDFVRR